MNQRIVNTLFLSGLLSLLAAVPAGAQQQICGDNETILRCLERLGRAQAATHKPDAREGSEKVQETKKKTETGELDSLRGLTSSVKDFLPILRFAGVIGDITKDDDSGVVAVALNTRFLSRGGLTLDPSFQAKALIATKPDLYSRIRDSLPEAERDKIAQTLLGDTERRNFTLEFSYNVTSRRLGRAFRLHSRMFQKLFESSYSRIKPEEALANQLLVTVTQIAVTGSTPHNIAETPWKELPEAKRTAIDSVIRTGLTSGAFDLGRAFRSVLQQTGLHLFGQLVNNQPQLHFTFSKSFKDSLFGPEAWSGRMTYEMGIDNSLNAMVEHADTACDQWSDATQAAGCLSKLEEFTRDSGTMARIKTGTRLAFFAEFSNSLDYSFSSVPHSIAIAAPSTTAFSVGVDYGQLYGVLDDGTASARLDASLKWDRPAEESGANSRFIASVTVSKRFGELSIPLGLVYASKAEHLKDVDHVLSAHVGLKFKLFDK